MSNVTWKKSAVLMVLAGTLLVGACATQDSVTHAQATADEALQKANAANAKLDRMYQQGLQK